MADEFDDNKVEGGEAEETEEKPELPPEPVDRNEEIAVPVSPRAEKKRNRFKEFEESAAAARREAEEARREAAEAKALLQQRMAHPQDQSRQQQANPHHQRIAEIDDATRRLHKEYEIVASRPGFTPQQHEEYERKALALQTAKMAAVNEATRQPVNEQEMYRRWKWNDFQTKHNDIFGDPKRVSWAIGRWQQMVGGEGLADTEENAEMILDQARVKFGIKPRRSSGNGDAATRARLSGISGQGGSTSGDTDGGAVKMGKRERQMAEAMYDNLSPREAWQKWANGPGKRAALKQASRK